MAAYACAATLSHPYPSCVHSFEVLPSGQILSVGGTHAYGFLKAWDRARGCMQTVTLTSSICCIVGLPGGLVVCGSSDGMLMAFDASADYRCLHTCKITNDGLLLPRAVRSLAVLPSGRVASGADDGALKLWDTTTWRCLQTLDAGRGHRFACMGVLPAERLISGAKDGHKVWDFALGQCVQHLTLTAQEEDLKGLAILMDGRICSASLQRLRLWDLTGRYHKVLIERATMCVAALSEDDRVVSGHYDQLVRVWNLRDGQCCQVLSGHEGWLKHVVVLPNGSIASTATDYKIKVWIDGRRLTEKQMAQLVGESRAISDVVKVITGFL